MLILFYQFFLDWIETLVLWSIRLARGCDNNNNSSNSSWSCNESRLCQLTFHLSICLSLSVRLSAFIYPLQYWHAIERLASSKMKLQETQKPMLQTNSRGALRINALAEIKQSYWLFQVSWLFLTNQCALFQRNVALNFVYEIGQRCSCSNKFALHLIL